MSVSVHCESHTAILINISFWQMSYCIEAFCLSTNVCSSLAHRRPARIGWTGTYTDMSIRLALEDAKLRVLFWSA
jgi:hypothetical protein